MIKYIVTSDEHLTNSNPNFRHDGDGVSDLLKAQVDYFKWIHDKVVYEDYRGVLGLGDLANEATLGPLMQTKVNEVVSILEKCHIEGRRGILIEGNHCVSDKKNIYTVLGATNLLRGNSSLDIVLEKKEIVHQTDYTFQVRFYCFPFMADYGQLERDIAEVNSSIERDDGNVHIMLFHFPVKNALLDNGMPHSSGVNLSEDIISNFDICLGGDFHRRQQVGSKVHYIGAPFDLKFGENYQRGITILNISEDREISLEFEENPFQYHLLKMSVEEALDTNLPHPGRTIMNVSGEANSEQLSQLEDMREDLYRLTLSVNRGKKVDKKDLSVNVIDSQGVRDVDLLRGQMKRDKVDPVVAKRALELFEEVQSEA